MSDFIPTTMMTSQRRRIPTDSSCKSWVATIKMQNSVGISKIKYETETKIKTISKSSQDFRSLWLKPKWPSCGIQILVESCRMPLDCGSTMFEHSWSVPPQVDVDGHSPSASSSSPHPSHRGFLSSPPSSRRSRTSPLQETHLQQSPIMSRDLSYGCCHAAAHITKHCRTLATEHYRASPIMSGDVGYGCRGDEAVGDWNFK